MDAMVAVLAGLFTNVVSFELGNRLSGRNGVSESSCKERREACDKLVCTKIDSVNERLDEMITLVKK